MEELFAVKNGDHCAVNQVLYHLGSRGVEYDLMPWLEEHHVPLMAYCPLAQGGDLRRGLLQNKAVEMVAEQRHITPMQVLLAFVLHHENVIAIPRSGKKEHVLENCQASEIKLTEEECRLLDSSFSFSAAIFISEYIKTVFTGMIVFLLKYYPQPLAHCSIRHPETILFQGQLDRLSTYPAGSYVLGQSF